MGAVKTLLTFADFEQLPEQPGRSELLEGEITLLPPAKKRHNINGKRLARALDPQIDQLRMTDPHSPVGEAFQEMGYLLGKNPGWWLVLDVSVTWANQPGSDYFEGSPMIAFEIVSESNRPAHIARKLKKYLECGAAEVWVIYPETLHAMVFTQSGERREDAAVHSERLPGVNIPFSDFL